MQEMYLTPALVLLIGAVAISIFVALCFRRFGGIRLDDASDTDRRAAPINLAKGESPRILQEMVS
jgi:hypothetical protein